MNAREAQESPRCSAPAGGSNFRRWFARRPLNNCLEDGVDQRTIGEHFEVVSFHSPDERLARLCGCEKFELPNFGAGLHRELLFISAHTAHERGGRYGRRGLPHAIWMLWFFSGNERMRWPVAAKIALITAGSA